jgi:hypothetical protein
MKTSIYLDRDSAQLLDVLVDELDTSVSGVIQLALKHYAESLGYVIIPQRIEKKDSP